MVWVVSLLAEDLLMIRSTVGFTWYDKLSKWFRYPLNIIKGAAFCFYVLGLSLRYVPNDDDNFYSSTLRWARMMFSIDVCLFFLRGLDFFLVHKELGPKLSMIYKMIGDVIVFIAILLVWILSYGIAVQALLFPFQDASWEMLKNVIYIPFWQLHGELFLDYVEGKENNNCIISHHVSVNGTLSDHTICPRREWLVLVLLAVYVSVTVIILLNLLIAIFNDTYSTIQNEAHLLWKYQRYRVVVDYIHKSPFPHPFAWLTVLHLMVTAKQSKKEDSALYKMRNELSSDQLDSMVTLEAQSLERVIKANKEIELD
ncbi:transient receptor potential cation channel subfamily M member-like 2 [Corticium candelabrum]|uniref:transient receptor potential cation channel subfamily M member-like 2 n=1 Tax=Corticium candelabrum TaxID=121492 RepID=UPI002E2702BF|nr:transient receptor potential cation channel subfamily M member-like 2 [Corticium candelabrum]